MSSSKTLVILDDFTYTSTHSLFFTLLSKTRNLEAEISYKTIDDFISIKENGSFVFSSIVLLAPRLTPLLQSKNKDLSIDNLLKFVDNGGNLVILADSSVLSFTRKLANEFGVDFDNKVVI